MNDDRDPLPDLLRETFRHHESLATQTPMSVVPDAPVRRRAPVVLAAAAAVVLVVGGGALVAGRTGDPSPTAGSPSPADPTAPESSVSTAITGSEALARVRADDALTDLSADLVARTPSARPAGPSDVPALAGVEPRPGEQEHVVSTSAWFLVATDLSSAQYAGDLAADPPDGFDAQPARNLDDKQVQDVFWGAADRTGDVWVDAGVQVAPAAGGLGVRLTVGATWRPDRNPESLIGTTPVDRAVFTAAVATNRTVITDPDDLALLASRLDAMPVWPPTVTHGCTPQPAAPASLVLGTGDGALTATRDDCYDTWELTRGGQTVDVVEDVGAPGFEDALATPLEHARD